MSEPESASTPPPHREHFTFDRRIVHLKRRLLREASFAVGMLEAGLDALWRLDVQAAREVRGRDDRVDREEVQIERECFELLALHHAFARDFRVLTFILKVNADLERVADHAASIAKIAGKIHAYASQLPGAGDRPQVAFPTALRELGDRVPMMCHALMRAVIDEDTEAARSVVQNDKVIDQLDRRLFEEVSEFIRSDPRQVEVGLLIARLGRELERVGDLMTNMAEDLVYLATGEIIRHEKRPRLPAP